MTILRDLYSRLPAGVTISSAAVTGYGEDLLKAALRADTGEVETMAHYKAAAAFLPGVEFILDIGGQDMKAIRIKGGVIDSIILNEACSSGCGSFVETFAVPSGSAWRSSLSWRSRRNGPPTSATGARFS